MKNPCLNYKIVSLTLICILITISSISLASAQSTAVKATASSSQPRVGETFTVKIEVSNVQNLAGLDTILQWDPSILSLSNVALNLGVESHSNGVLHGNQLNYDYNSVNVGDIYVNETKMAGSYELEALSIGQATQSFSGSGTVATLTFNVTGTGSAGLTIESELADHPASGETANLIDHSDVADSVTTVVPEFSSIASIAVMVIAATAALLVSKKRLNTIKS